LLEPDITNGLLQGELKWLLQPRLCRLTPSPPVLAWWNARKQNPHAWKVKAQDIIASGYNLDRKNPHADIRAQHADPQTLIAEMRSHEEVILRLLGEIEVLAGGYREMKKWPKITLAEICTPAIRHITLLKSHSPRLLSSNRSTDYKPV